MLGGGVIGLTVAVALAEAGHAVLVRAAEPPHATTSAAAGALWGPWLAQPRARVLRWAERSLSALTELAAHPDTGVHLASGKGVSAVKHEPPEWFRLLPDARPCTADDLPAGHLHGIRYTAPLVNMPVHLAYLVDRLRSAGGAVEIGAVTTLDQAAESAPIVVNCTGLGARVLVGDRQLYPVRGQQVVVTNPGIDEFLEVDTGDSTDLIAIYPHGDHAILGGTAQPYSWQREADKATTKSILLRCIVLQPKLKAAEIIGERVGLRPTRPTVRLEEQRGPGNTRIIHNYGHGGAGISLSWGCAEEVLTLIDSGAQ